ncbi:LiaG family protein [Ferdinandcohnia quinoae]|uniref:DUF4097 domain-containing protein n=1 Tax=Fredinandcohnia quinoae TaxID=2918902 RepID=A0AAW5EFD0_9BACI|nr:DUF4097 family beta strand repeat-containing protein [Fredinandcohnia sp. SECRCQ15]MCH1627903.1 DUF4097 domain-containing protein [Fredinandcohnia sp. SECRCQ15]
MKKILIIFFILIGVYLVFTNLHRIPGLAFGSDGDEVKLTNKIDLIDIDINSISATIIPENRNTIKADLKGKGEVKVSKSGDTITVEYKKKWFDIISIFNHSKLTIYIPEEYDRDLELNVGSGNMKFSGSEMELEKLSVTVQSGNINLKNLKVDEFTQDVASGNATINSLATGEGTINVSSGNTTLNDYSGKLDAKVSSGRLKAQMDKLTGSVNAKVSSGILSLDLPDDADFTLNAKVSSGLISNHFPLDNSKQEKGDIEGTHGSGKHKVNLKVSSGKLDIY